MKDGILFEQIRGRSEEVTFKLKPKDYVHNTVVRVAVLCVWESMKEEHVKILRWQREYGF